MNGQERDPVTSDRVVIEERARQIADDAPCVGCGTTLAACKAARGKDPTAPEWFGCCARGTAMAPCSHRADPAAVIALLSEVTSGHVRTATEVAAERAGRRGPVSALIFDQGAVWQQRSGEWIEIADMGAGHRYNAAAMLMRDVDVHAALYAWKLNREIDVSDPAAWLRNTVLYRALTAGLTVHGDGTQPWQATGRDPVTGEPTEVPPPRPRPREICRIPGCGCSGLAHP